MVSQWRYVFMEWECCEHVWQLLIRQRYSQRSDWRPMCPTCGESGQSYNEMYGERR